MVVFWATSTIIGIPTVREKLHLILFFTGTVVTKVVATDADEQGNKNSQIAYSIVDQKPDNGMFHMTKDGTIRVAESILDREV